MTYNVIIESQAMKNLETIVVWIAEENERAARHWYVEMVAAIESLKNLPDRCPVAPESELFAREIRQLLHGKHRNKYRILFTLVGDTVHILHIRHGARDWVGPEELGPI